MVSTIEDRAAISRSTWGRRAVLGAKALREMHRPQWLLDDWQLPGGRHAVRRVEGGRASDIRELRRLLGDRGVHPALSSGRVLSNADDGNPASYCDYALQLLTPIAAKAAARAQAP